jgi:CHASE2 domain-containing sensor protein
MHQLLGLRSRLLRAHRDGRVLPQHEDAVAEWIEWIDARAGDLARYRLARRRRAERRMARASMFLLFCVLVAIACGFAGIGTFGVGVMMVGVAISAIVALISIPAFFGTGNLEQTARQAEY